MANAAPPAPAATGDAADRRFLTFRIEEVLYALPAEAVAEVIRPLAAARVPQAPASLLGVANLRGAVLPVASLSALLGRDVAPTYGKAIVLAGVTPVAIAVDGVEALVSIPAGEIETDQAQLAATQGEVLNGAFSLGPVGGVAKILDIQALLNVAFVPRERAVRRIGVETAEAHGDDIEQDRDRLLTFEVAGQEFALSLGDVREVISVPERLTAVPRSETLILGMTSYRDRLLPLLSLRGLLGLPAAETISGKVVVASMNGLLIGLLVDRMRSIVPADPGLIEPIPSVLAVRTGGETRIKAIYRGEDGRRLISILAPDLLFAEDVMKRLQASQPADAADETATLSAQERRILVFRLGDEEFGLPIEAVDEVANAPSQITKIPKTPDFLEGVINLRGDVLPVVDQRRRFGMPAHGGAGRRLVVVRSERHRAGLIVDSVSEVLRIKSEAIEEAPDLTGEADRLVDGVINLEGSKRIVLVLDPSELLTRAERSLLDAFGATAAGSA